MFTQYKSMKHMCWTNTGAGITHFLMKESEKRWHVERFQQQPSCAFERSKPWQQDSVLDHLEGQQTLLCSGELWKRAQASHNSAHAWSSPASNPQPSLAVYQIILLGDGVEGGDKSSADIWMCWKTLVALFFLFPFSNLVTLQCFSLQYFIQTGLALLQPQASMHAGVPK